MCVKSQIAKLGPRSMSERKLKVGVSGLGRAFTLMLPTLMGDSRIQMVTATDPHEAACRQFERDFGVACVKDFKTLCEHPGVEVIYIASPHQFHAEQVEWAASHGKHVLVEKPMALNMDECNRMIHAVQKAGTLMLVGHSHSFNGPILKAVELINSGEYGEVRMIHALNYTDFLYRPRRPEELDTQKGGGVIFSQAAHQLDIVRLLGGGLVQRVSAQTGAWDPVRATEGAYSAILSFTSGAFASVSYSGYAHFDSDQWMGGIGELGNVKDPQNYGAAKKRLSALKAPEEEAHLKAARNYGAAQWDPSSAVDHSRAHQHFGPLIISCDRADLRPVPTGVWVDGDRASTLLEIPKPEVPRQEVIDELYGAIFNHQPILHSGQWARATTELSLAILESSRKQEMVNLQFQIKPYQNL